MATYSFKDVAASIVGVGGAVPLADGSGAAEEGITFAMEEDKNTMTIGADGSVMHSLHAGNAGKATIRLLKTSPFNALLDLMYNVQRQTSLTWGQNVITCADLARGDVITCTTVAFAKAPDVVYAKVGNTNEWEFHVGQLIRQLGTGVPDVNIGA